jgi:hypothetical protein
MVPKPLEFNAIGSGAAQWWETMERRPIMGVMFTGVLIALIAVIVWYVLLG